MQPPPKMASGRHTLPQAKHKKKLFSLPLIQLKRSGTFLFLEIFEVLPLLLEGELPYFADKIIPAEKECACA